jgi:hypothetical protein
MILIKQHKKNIKIIKLITSKCYIKNSKKYPILNILKKKKYEIN